VCAAPTARASSTRAQIDRFLERKLVIRQKLQLVGVTAMLLASKYEEIYAPEVRDFVYITDKAYTREQILAMEAQMLNTLDFKVRVRRVCVCVCVRRAAAARAARPAWRAATCSCPPRAAGVTAAECTGCWVAARRASASLSFERHAP